MTNADYNKLLLKFGRDKKIWLYVVMLCLLPALINLSNVLGQIVGEMIANHLTRQP